jgi:TP901 family phage tail tape measure protein
MPPLELRLIVTAQSQMGPGLAQVRQEIQALQADLAKVTEQGIKPMDSAVRSLGERVKAALVFFGAFRAFWAGFNFIMDAVRSLFELEQQLKRVQSATIFDPKGLATTAQLMESFTIGLARYGLTVKQTGDALFELISAGLTLNQAQQLSITVFALAKAGIGDVGTAARVVAGIFRTWGVDSQHLGDVLAYVLTKSQVEINGLVTGLQRVAATARLSGLSFEQTVAALAVMNDAMIFGGNAGRAFRRAIEQIVQETDFFQERLGITIDRTKDFGAQFDQVVVQLGRAMEKGGEPVVGELAKQFERFGIFGQQGIAALRLFAKEYTALVGTMSGKAETIRGALDQMVSIRMDNAIDQFARLKGSITAALSVFDSGILKDFVRSMANVIQFGPELAALVTTIEVSVRRFTETNRDLSIFQSLLAGIRAEASEMEREGLPVPPAMVERITGLETAITKLQKESTNQLRMIKGAFEELPKEAAAPLEALLEAIGAIPRGLQTATKAAEQFHEGLRVLTRQTVATAAEMANIPLGIRLETVHEALLKQLQQLKQRAFEVNIVTEDGVKLEERKQLLIGSEAEIQQTLMLIARDKVRANAGEVDQVEKIVKHIKTLIGEEETLNKILEDARLAFQAGAERFDEATARQINRETQLLALKQAELRLQNDIAAAVEKATGIKTEITPGQLPPLPPLGQFDKAQLAEVIKLYVQIIVNTEKQKQVQGAWNQEAIAGLEKQIALIERTAALQLKDIDLKEQIDRATKVVTADMEKMWNLKRLSEVTTEIEKIQQRLEELQKKAAAGLFKEGGADAEKLDMLIAKLQVLREQQIKLSLTQQSDLDAFLNGMRQGVSEFNNGFKEMTAAGLSFVRDLQSAISEGIFNTLKNGFTGFSDFLTKIGDSLLRIIANFAASKILSFFGSFLPNATLPSLATAQMNVVAGTVILSGGLGAVQSGITVFPASSLPPGSAQFAENAQAASNGLEQVATASVVSANGLGIFGQLLGWLGNTMSLFGSSMGGLIKFIGVAMSALVSLFSASGTANAAGSAGSFFSAGGGGSGIMNLLLTIGRGISTYLTSAWTGISSFFGFGGAAGTSAGGLLTMASGAAGVGGAAGSLAATLFTKVIPFVGTAISIIMDLINGNLRGAGLTFAGAAIGTYFLPGIGTAIGAVIGKLIDILINLFEGPPTATLYIQWRSTFLGKMDEFMRGVVGSFGVFVSADLPNAKQRELETQLSTIVNGVLRVLLGAFTTASASLPASITATMQAGLARLANSGQWVMGGQKEGFHDFPLDRGAKELEAFIKDILPDRIIQQFFTAMSGGLDLNVLRHTEESFSDAFTRVLNSMAGLAELMKVFQVDADGLTESIGTGEEALRQYVKSSLFFFESFRVGTETFKETSDRISAAIGGMQAILEATGQSLPTARNLNEMFQIVTDIMAFFTTFQKEGEAFADTVKRVTDGILGMVGMIQQLEAAIVGLTGTADDALALALRQIDTSADQIDLLLKRLQDAITQPGAQPDEILALGKAVTDAVTKSFQSQIDLAKALSAEVDRLRASLIGALQLFASLATTLFSLREHLAGGAGGALDTFWDAINRLVTAFQQADTVEARIEIISAGLGIFIQALNDVITAGARLPDLIEGFNEFNGLLQEGFDWVMGDIFAMTDPARAVANLKTLADAIVQATNAEIAAAQRYFQEEATRLTAASQLRIDALNAEKTAITEAADVQKAALNTQLELSRKWVSVLDSVKSQLTGLFNLIAPTHPLTSLTDVRSQFQAAVEQFKVAPTPELAKIIQDLGAQAIDLAKSTPGFELPSLAFKQLFDEITAALNLIKSVAEPTISEADILQQIADIDKDAADRLAAIDLSIKAEQDALQVALDANSAKEQEILTFLRQQAVERLQRLQDALTIRLDELAVQEQLASDRLHALIGDRTLDEFIAAKNAEQATLLGEIRDLLTDMLGALGFESPVSAARLSEAVLSLVKIAELAQGLFEGGQLGTPEIGQQLMIASQQAALRQPQGVIDALNRVLELGQVFFNSDVGTAAMTALSQVIGDISDNRFQAAVNGLAALVQMLNDAGITNRVIVPGFQHGLAFVPQDDFVARLHRGERVLTAEENARFSGSGHITIAPTITVTVEGGANLTAEDIAKAVEKGVVYSLTNGAGAKVLKERLRARN